MARHVHDEAMADAPRGADARVARHDRAHQLVGMEAALHQRLGPSGAHQRDRLGGGIMAVLGVDQFEARDVEAAFRRPRDPRRRADQDRLDKTQLRRLDRASSETGSQGWHTAVVTGGCLRAVAISLSCFSCGRSAAFEGTSGMRPPLSYTITNRTSVKEQ